MTQATAPTSQTPKGFSISQAVHNEADLWPLWTGKPSSGLKAVKPRMK